MRNADILISMIVEASSNGGKLPTAELTGERSTQIDYLVDGGLIRPKPSNLGTGKLLYRFLTDDGEAAATLFNVEEWGEHNRRNFAVLLGQGASIREAYIGTKNGQIRAYGCR